MSYTTKLTPSLAALTSLGEAMEWDHGKFPSLAYIDCHFMLILARLTLARKRFPAVSDLRDFIYYIDR